jgi:hypothetical protein
MTQKIQVGSTVRDMTEEEIAVYDATIAEAELNKQQREAAEAAKAAARQAVLDKLGLTADEAQALVGLMKWVRRLLALLWLGVLAFWWLSSTP